MMVSCTFKDSNYLTHGLVFFTEAIEAKKEKTGLIPLWFSVTLLKTRCCPIGYSRYSPYAPFGGLQKKLRCNHTSAKSKFYNFHFKSLDIFHFNNDQFALLTSDVKF